MMISIKTEIVLKTTPKEIWSLLTDFNNYQSWNPFIIKSEGQAILGSRLKNHLKINSKTQVFKPKITRVESNQYFEWIGSLFFKGLFDGRHYFEIQDLGDGHCKLIHGEHFSGILSGPILKKIKNETIDGFKMMNEAIKKELS